MNLNHFSLTKILYLYQNPTPGIFNLEGLQPWSPYRRAATGFHSPLHYLYFQDDRGRDHLYFDYHMELDHGGKLLILYHWKISQKHILDLPLRAPLLPLEDRI